MAHVASLLGVSVLAEAGAEDVVGGAGAWGWREGRWGGDVDRLIDIKVGRGSGSSLH